MSQVSISRLPTELIIRILHELEFKDLSNCKIVNKYFNDLISHTASLQYKMEFAFCGMEDGPLNGMVPAERLQCLREHQAAWAQMRFSSTLTVDMEGGNVWELYGNVLAQGRGRRSLVFQQLPSAIRGIEAKSWVLRDLGIDIRDFGMDPAEDLLVLIERQSSQHSNQLDYSIHLRTLASGETHPSAPKPGILTHTPQFRCSSFTIQLSGELLGIIFHSVDGLDNELIIWNWKRGRIQLAVSGEPLKAFAFLSERYILLAEVADREATLVVLDLETSSDQLISIKDAAVECEFQFSAISYPHIVVDIMLRSDPGPNWTPDPKLEVPFHIARKERLFVITATVFAPGDPHIHAYTLFVPSSTILRNMETYSGVIEWEQWGPSGTRVIYPTPPISRVWVCYVYGMRFTFLYRALRDDEPDKLYVFDFNQLSICKMRQKREDETADNWNLMMEESVIAPGDSIFSHTVKTSLPFRFRICDLKKDPGSMPVATMLSEDSVILVCSDLRGLGTSVRRYRILTF